VQERCYTLTAQRRKRHKYAGDGLYMAVASNNAHCDCIMLEITKRPSTAHAARTAQWARGDTDATTSIAY